MEFTIKIEMKSDWHIGLGQTKGDIDSIVIKDKEGLPYIPAKTLTGILRDSCETVALGLDDGEANGIWRHCLEFLFGSQPNVVQKEEEKEDKSEEIKPPIPAILSLRPAYLPQLLRQALNSTGKEKVKGAIAFIKPGIKIDNKTGTAEDKCLRYQEMIRTEAVLIAEKCAINFPDDINDTEKQMAYALLLAGVQITERIGGKRRRGAGKCQIAIVNNSEASNYFQKYDYSFITFLEEQIKVFRDDRKEKEKTKELLEKLSTTLDNDVVIKEIPNNQSKDNSSNSDQSKWSILSLEIKTITPVIIPKRTIGNVVETLDYIPAKYLLRSLHKLFNVSINVFDEINNGNLVITNGTIMINNQPSRPTPFCLFADKLEGGLDKGFVFNRLTEAEPKDRQLKAIRSDYIGKIKDNDLPKTAKVDINVYTHNTVKDDLQRPSSDVGGVYSYNAIVPNTVFKAEIRLKSELLEQIKKQNNNNDNWWENINGEYVIGQSKKDDYGKVEIKAKPPKSPKRKIKYDEQTNLLYVWLLSDVLLRDERLRLTGNLKVFRETLEKRLGVTLKERESNDTKQDNNDNQDNDHEDDLISVSVRQRRTESWQVRWRLPRPSLAGMQAGSCIVYQIQDNLDDQQLKDLKTKLKEIQITGIGKRRAEGYGQICFNDPLLTNKLSTLPPYPQEKKDDNESQTNQSNTINDFKSIKYAHLIEKQAWREAIQQKALALASDDKQREKILGVTVENGESCPPMTQLGNLRSILSKLKSKDDKTKVTTWMDSLRKRSNRYEKWDEKKLTKIEVLMADNNSSDDDNLTIWQHLSLPYDELTVTANGKETLKEELWAEAIRTLVDAIVRAHKRHWENQLSNDKDNQNND